ncbi:hypothetical protein [Allohahella marinimesophila]|uniref:Uncharacterized protein n=1 Tax=Allohahella marinimesophila TaxID=1054972 RepID=A0ABP7P7X6_9GAMM
MKTFTGASLPYMAAAAVGLAVLGWSQMGKQHSVQPEDFARTPSAPTSPLVAVTQQEQTGGAAAEMSAELITEVNTLREHVATLVEHQSLTQEELDVLRNSIASDASVLETHDERTSTPEEEVVALEARFSQMDAYLERETPDPQWGADTRSSIESSIEQAELTGVTLLESNCGTTLCKVKLNLPADLTPEDSLQRLATRRTWDGATMFRLSGSGEADFYIARVGHELPVGE